MIFLIFIMITINIVVNIMTTPATVSILVFLFPNFFLMFTLSCVWKFMLFRLLLMESGSHVHNPVGLFSFQDSMVSVVT